MLHELRRPCTSDRTLKLMIAAALTAGVAGCGGTRRSAEKAGESEVVDRLRALPYLGFSSEKAERSGVVHNEPGRVSAGVNLYTTRNLCRADLIDLEGRTLKTWQEPDCQHWSHAELLSNGDLLVTGNASHQDKGSNRAEFMTDNYLLRLDWEGKQVWKTPVTAHHDVEVTPSGQLATLTVTYRRIREYDPETVVCDKDLVLLSPEGRVLETASFYQLLTSNPAELALQSMRKPKPGSGRPPDVDLFHANAVEFMRHRHLVGRHLIYSLDNVLVTVRHQDVVAVIDWPRKKLVWAWGQGELSGPHAGTVLENGNILIFDNGLSRGWSRVVELDPVAKKIVWEYKAPDPKKLFTLGRGSAQRLPNGNTLISNSDRGQVLEVTPAGEVVWEFLNPLTSAEGHRATITRMTRYEPAFIEKLLAEQPRTAPQKPRTGNN